MFVKLYQYILLFNKLSHANDFQHGETCNMAAIFHIMSYIEHIVNCNNYVWLANGLVKISFVNIDATMICV